MLSLIAAPAVYLVLQQDPAVAKPNVATATEPVVHTATVDAPIDRVWKAFTDEDDIRTWLVAETRLNLKIGGKWLNSYKKGSDFTGSDYIEHTILSFDPGRMISFRTTRTPQGFPFPKAMESAWSVIYLDPVSPSQTRVTMRMNGYTNDPESQKMKAFFQAGNQQVLDQLVKKFAKQ